MDKKGKKKSVLIVAYNEFKKEKLEKRILILIMIIFLVSSFSLLIFLTSRLLITGYATYLQSRGGYITEVNLIQTFATSYWYGTYGLAIRVSGFTEQLYLDAVAGEIDRKDLFFDCMIPDSTGARKVFASTSPTIYWDFLNPATVEMVDAFTGCSDNIQCASNTFLESMSIAVGSRTITNIPATHTYRYDGGDNAFSLGILNDSINLVFVANISDIQRGYNQDYIVNYQMLLPVPFNSSSRYYFFTDSPTSCPSGGVGENIGANVYGYIKSISGAPLENVNVIVAGYDTYSDINGFYNLTFLVTIGNYSLIAKKPGYDTYITNLSVNYTQYIFNRNITMTIVTPGLNYTMNPHVYGYVIDDSSNVLADANISLGDSTTSSDINGYYSFYPTIVPGLNPLIATKIGYNNNYTIINFSLNNLSVTYNFTLNTAQDKYPYETGPYETGPYASGPYSSPPGTRIQAVIQQAKKNGEDYWISTEKIYKEVRQNTFIEDIIGIYNFKTSRVRLAFEISPELQDFVKIDSSSAIINTDSFFNLGITFYGNKPVGIYNGSLKIAGDIIKTIPILVKIVEKRFSMEALLIKPEVFKKIFSPGEDLNYKITLQNLLRDQSYKISLNISLKEANGNITYYSVPKNVEITDSLSLIDIIKISPDIPEGEYILNVDAEYLNLFSSASTHFTISKPIYLYSLFGFPVWIMLALISLFAFIFLNIFIYTNYQQKKKRYRINIDYDTLPKPGNKVVRIGNLAETKTPAYYDIERLTTHAIVAGATGMGKSISAQVIVEEALMQNIAVIVFDPTAQWSGMLRKCEDKKMLSFYPKFGLKESDARAFKGNVRQVRNSRELIEIEKYMNPGQIKIFSLNKLDPSQMDIFVSNVIRQIFKSDPKESPDLKLLIVFDEVHRLLAKFGGSGEGFLQVERACREFRKWGIGVMLISQVLSDFVGEIKANISTEVQMRTRDEGDLSRINTKYGEESLRSLVKSSIGVGMFVNTAYNHSNPYFINFRPILHNTRRLPDEELEKYNKYNDIVDDLDYQIAELEKEKVDTFDLKMELKLVKDKLMTGSFLVVEIYLEGLRPRIDKGWEKLGKKPSKREIKLVDESEIKKSIEEAKKAREKFEAEESKKQKEAKKEEVASPEQIKKNLEEKEFTPLIFDNGIMVSSLKELKSILPALDNAIFKTHVNKNKNDISDWILKNISKELGEKLKDIIVKKEMILEFENFGKEKPSLEIKELDKKDKESDKNESKKEKTEDTDEKAVKKKEV